MTKTEARVEPVYVDPSALARLYFHHEEGSRAMALWRRKNRGSLAVTHHGRAEVVNAIGRAAYRGLLSMEDALEAWQWLDADFAAGHLVEADVLWRAALKRASELSKKHTPELGTRTLDVLHVACAVELKLRSFLTFDERQGELAQKCGLKLVRLRA